MKKYIFSYKLLNTNEQRRFGIVTSTEKEAKEKIADRVADFEFTDVENVEILDLEEVTDDKDNYFECESCT